LRRSRSRPIVGRVHTPPDDLPERALRVALDAGWSLRARTLEYRAVGFGSHHWEVSDGSGARWFVTVDDLRGRRVSVGEPLTAGYDRLRASLLAAQSLQAAGCDVVVAPRSTYDGEPLAPLAESFAVAVYPYIDGESFSWGAYRPDQRLAVLDLLIALHQVPALVSRQARVDDYAIPFRDSVSAVMAATHHADHTMGPYAMAAVELVVAHAPGLGRALGRYDDLVDAARVDAPGLVLTHGEPHPGNTMRTHDGWRLIDWDTALLAPPERDLWDLDPGDSSVYAAYRTATGVSVRPDLLELYRLRWGLSEIAVYLARFCRPHGSTADDAESWTNLEEAVRDISTIW
jgi:hypothetical protein